MGHKRLIGSNFEIQIVEKPNKINNLAKLILLCRSTNIMCGNNYTSTNCRTNEQSA